MLEHEDRNKLEVLTKHYITSDFVMANTHKNRIKRYPLHLIVVLTRFTSKMNKTRLTICVRIHGVFHVNVFSSTFSRLSSE